MKKLPVQGSGRGYAPGRIPVAARARFDFRNGVLDLAAAAEYLLYGAAAGVGAGLLWKAGRWIGRAIGSPDGHGLDLLGAELLAERTPPARGSAFDLIGAERFPTLADDLELLDAELLR